jgi:hypothetical protein
MDRSGKAAACWAKQAKVGRLGLLGRIPGENSNKVGIRISRILEFGNAWKNSTRRFRRNLNIDFFLKSSRFLKDF